MGDTAPRNPATGPRNGKWKGGTTSHWKGYVRYSAGPHRNRMVHVVMMETLLGRRLAKGENVHHMDFDKTHNCCCNYILVTAAFHGCCHAVGKLRGEGGKFKKREREQDQAPDWVTDPGGAEDVDVGTDEAY